MWNDWTKALRAKNEVKISENVWNNVHINHWKEHVKSNAITLRLIVKYSLLYVVGPEKDRWSGL